MRVLIFGGGGFIGSRLGHAMTMRGDTVTLLDQQYKQDTRHWWQIAANRMTGDLRAPGVASRAIQDAVPDLVVNMAADMGGVGYFHSAADPLAARNNMRITLNVVDACEYHNVPLFHASSACSYPTSYGTEPLREQMLGEGPADAMYGEEKRFATLLSEHYDWMRVGVFHTIYGPGQETTGKRSKFPPAICHKVYEAWKTGGPVEVWGTGAQTRTFLYIDDALERILRVIDHDTNYGPINIGSDELVTINQCVGWLTAHAGITPEIVHRLDQPTGVADRSSDNTNFHALYGPAQVTPAKEGFARLYDWIAAQDRLPQAA